MKVSTPFLSNLVAIVFILFTTIPLGAQNVGIGTNTPDASAKLEIVSDSSGVLVPRMTDTERDAITNPATGLLVFVTTDSTFNYFDGTSWVHFSRTWRPIFISNSKKKDYVKGGVQRNESLYGVH